MNQKKKILLFLVIIFAALILGAIIATILNNFDCNFFKHVNLPSWIKAPDVPAE